MQCYCRKCTVYTELIKWRKCEFEWCRIFTLTDGHTSSYVPGGCFSKADSVYLIVRCWKVFVLLERNGLYFCQKFFLYFQGWSWFGDKFVVFFSHLKSGMKRKLIPDLDSKDKFQLRVNQLRCVGTPSCVSTRLEPLASATGSGPLQACPRTCGYGKLMISPQLPHSEA